MLEVTSISASSYDPDSLTPMLNDKVGEGWEIISIVSAGTKVIAYLQREAVPGAEPSGGVAMAAATEEPAGWASAPEETSTADSAAVGLAAAAAVTAAEPEPTQQVAQQEAQQQSVQPESAVPAGWYADPSGRYELRYWDGNAWTEHVSRAGQQYTDPPVA